MNARLERLESCAPPQGQGDSPGQTPVLSVEDFVLGERARFDSVEYIVIRMVFLVFVMIMAATAVVELLKLAVHG